MIMRDPFVQAPPQLGNQYLDDEVLISYLNRVLPAEVMQDIAASLEELGEIAVNHYALQLADRENEPKLVQWDAWGNRVDRIELTALWQEAEKVAARLSLVATAYEKAHGKYSRIHQFAKVYLFTPSSDIYSCPLAMTDGAARTLMLSQNKALIERALPHLLSRDPESFWTSGQWMTEASGGSDVGLSESTAVRDERGAWRLHGRKWFTSAIASQMALTLARPDGNGPGGKGLALFYLETRNADGTPQNILIHRLKDKLGTRKLPTAEITLKGTEAELVMGTADGVRNIAPMLNITRTWNSISAVSYMRRGLALARDYAQRRSAFGATLAEKPLFLDTLAGLQAEFEAGFHLAFYLVEWLGKEENEGLSAEEQILLRLLTPIVKLTTARQAVLVASEIVELFGGAGYVEDTGLPLLLRDSQVFPIWEGTTHVLALDCLNTLESKSGFSVLKTEILRCIAGVSDVRLTRLVESVKNTLTNVETWRASAANVGVANLEAGARRLALTLGRTLALALLLRHAQWMLEMVHDVQGDRAALRFAQNGFDLIATEDLVGAKYLALRE